MPNYKLGQMSLNTSGQHFSLNKVYHFVLAHTSLGLAAVEPSTQKWQPRTPAMAAGATDQLWTLDELLRFRVPPWTQEAAA